MFFTVYLARLRICVGVCSVYMFVFTFGFFVQTYVQCMLVYCVHIRTPNDPVLQVLCVCVKSICVCLVADRAV